MVWCGVDMESGAGDFGQGEAGGEEIGREGGVWGGGERV